MKWIPFLVAILLCGCAGRFDTVPATAFPNRLTREQADSLYESHALRCDDGECSRGDGKRPLRAYTEHAYAPAKDVAKSKRRARIVGTVVPAATGGAALLLGVAFLSIASNTEQQALDSAEFGVDPTANLEKASDYRTFSTAMFVVGPTLMATGLVLGLALPDGEEEFQEEYNRALRQDLDRRTGPTGVVMLPPRTLR